MPRPGRLPVRGGGGWVKLRVAGLGEVAGRGGRFSAERGVGVDEAGFSAAMDEQRERAKADRRLKRQAV